MPAKKYIVKLAPSEREQLLEMTRKGELGARKMKRAQILLKADEGWNAVKYPICEDKCLEKFG
ncbi:MAG: hypothetical protein JXA89_26810 [Anaerolineae bacterium]|nr:hypothetical protein [Anaerolineae bacterium]